MNNFLIKLKSFVSKYSIAIIVCLIVLLFFRGCKIKSTERNMKYNEKIYEYIIDSLNTILSNDKLSFENERVFYNNEINKLHDSIYVLNAKNQILIDAFDDIKIDRDHYRKINKDLVNVTNNLSIKNDTIN